ncbi:GLPGLI family protein [Flavobacterium saccharophilum]|uniref:GLPGLI family protein n=1 Tax=Flavobacterium saccharophilum TaxID=29534 RepID=A0A1M7BG43_9FLAO|nr:GLPGLI family protein [Flavobacterium saccharophilum]SHL53579.1 GLPGLI family protein [Flavobacterium saccharophilum]
MRNIFLLFFFSFAGFSQTSGIAYYGIQLPEYKGKNGEKSDILSEAKKVAESHNFILEFNETQSHFYLSNEMENEGANVLINGVANIISGHENYYDKGKQLSINKHVDGILIKDKNAVKSWTITNETKVIDNYLCYKAEFIKKYKGYNGEMSKTIIAWFAPSLPFPFGPNSYNGLPGLVLELIETGEKVKTYFIKKIELKEQSILIKFPEGKVLTEEEFMKNSTYIPK